MAVLYDQYSYTTDAGTVIKIRMSKDAAAASIQGATNTAIDDTRLWAYASHHGNRRNHQCNARGVQLQRDITAGTYIIKRFSFMPITTQTALNSAAIGATVTIGGVSWTVSDKIGES